MHQTLTLSALPLCALFTFLTLPLAVGSAYGADVLSPLIVEGDAIVEVGEVEHEEFTGSYTHISGSELATENESLASVIARSAGVQFKQAGAAGSYSSITIRGATGAQTDFFLDGVLLNNAGNGTVDLSQFDLLNFGSIDIYRGSTPVQLGTANIGGAVNLRTAADPGDSMRVLLGTGSFGERKAQVALQGSGTGRDFSVALSHHASDNQFSYLNDNGTDLNELDDKKQHRRNSEFSRNTLLAKLSLVGSESQRYDALLQHGEREQAIPHFRNVEGTRTQFDTGSTQFQINRRTQSSGDDGWNHSQGVYVNQNTDRYDDSLSQVGLGAQNTDVETTVGGLRAYWDRVADSGTFSINSDFRVEKLASNDFISNESYTARRNSAKVMAQYSLFRLDDRLLLAPVLRFTGIQDTYSGVLRSGRADHDGTTINAQLGLRWEQTEHLQLSANLGQHQREPVFFELFGDRGFYVGNSDLVAEEGINVDMSAQWNLPGMLTGRLSGKESGQMNARPPGFFRLTVFGSERDELIASVYDARGIGRSENTGAASVWGLETTANWSFTRHWLTKINMTWQSAKNQSTDRAYAGKQLPGEARIAANLTLQFQRGPWHAWYEFDYTGERFYDPGNVLPADDALIHNVGLSFNKKTLRLTLLLDNLADEINEDFNGFPKPGRSIHFALTYSFDGSTS